jgi:5-(carboxyamino)imidazole ribonucleotide synthase
MTQLNPILLPGATLGVLGGGQLGRMFTQAAKRMGYAVHIFAPEADAPAKQIADTATTAPYEDEAALRAFAQVVDGVTLEFENIPAQSLAVLDQWVPVFPQQHVLSVSQHRLREKTYLKDAGFPVTPFYPVQTEADLPEGLARLGTPAVLKTAGYGYDGKGQAKVTSLGDAQAAFASLDHQPAILEQWVAYQCEFSVIVARNVHGELTSYDVFENQHRHHILDVTFSPALTLSPDQAAEAQGIARAVCEALNVVGVLCIEFFLTESGAILINELAPRPHNSGHLTIEGAVTSQFEQQVRAICGLPLGSTERVAPAAAMANLLGDGWAAGEPRWVEMLRDPAIKLHLYGKSTPRAGRKMGHLTVLADTPQAAADRVRAARAVLMPGLV